MEIGIERDYNASLLAGRLDDSCVISRSQANLASMNNVDPSGAK